MLRKLVFGVLAGMLFTSAQAATDYPSGYTKCAQIGGTCTMTGTRQTALGKSGSFVYATKTGSFACTNAAYPANSYPVSAWCSYAGTTTSSSSASSTASSASSQASSSSSTASSKSSSSTATGTGYVATHGALHTVGNQLVDKNNAAIQLRGMSSHGLQWFGQYINANSIKWLRDDWGITVIRGAMYTVGNNDGYIANPSGMTAKVYEMIDAAIANGIYVIVDWHILSDGNPQTYKSQAKTFFAAVSKKYGNVPNIIYEIANEPNGSGVTWNAAIRPYAQEVIPVIRANAPSALVIVGTATWSQDVTDAAANPVSFANVAYTVHFYACTHGQSLRDKVDAARAMGVTIFSTEWGTTDASGSGALCTTESKTWISFMNDRKISWANWSLATGSSGSYALLPGASVNGGWSASNISPSGTLVKSLIKQ